MNEKKIIREIMNVKGLSQCTLAKKAGLTGQSTISELLRNRSMKVESFVRLLDAMDYKLIVVSKNPKTDTNKWTVDYSKTIEQEVLDALEEEN